MVNDRLHTFLWESGRLTDLGSLNRRSDIETSPLALNERGQVVGSGPLNTRDGAGEAVEHGFLWQDGRMIELPPLRSPRDIDYPPESVAWAINDKGQVAGNSDTRRRQKGSWVLASGYHAVVWVKGKAIDLGTLAKSRYDRRVNSSAIAINSSGWIVGYSEPSEDGTTHATLWRAGRVIDLHPGGHSSEAHAINDRGQVVLQGGRGPGLFVWQNGRATGVGPLPGGQTSLASDINEVGWVVGTSSRERTAKGTCDTADGGYPYACSHAVVWTTR